LSRRKPKEKPMDGVDYGVLPIGAVRPDGAVPVLEETMVAGVKRVRNHSVILQWLASGEIEARHRDAADAFERDYHDAHLMPGYKSCLASLLRVDGQSADDPSRRSVVAYWRARGAMDDMGEFGAPAAEAVICQGKSLRTYAGEAGMTVDTVKGLLLSALGVLVVVYRT